MTTKPILTDLPMPIETPRLILRPPTLNDADEITKAMQAVWPELQRWMAWAFDGENTLEATRRAIEKHPENSHGILVGFCKATGQFAVATGLGMNDQGYYETGYWVAKNFLGLGYATEACIAAVRYGFEVMRAPSITIHYREGNVKSARIIEKMGFTPVSVLPKAVVRCSDGVMVDRHNFIMTDPSVLPPLDVRWGPP